MAIRPVDLQGAFVGAQANAAIVRNAEEAPAIAQAAANAQFASHVQDREETIEETQHAAGNKVRPRGEEQPDQQTGQQRRQHAGQEAQSEEETPTLGFAGEGHHFIDVIA